MNFGHLLTTLVLGRRAWHQARTALSTLRLVSNYLPVQTNISHLDPASLVSRGTPGYYIQRLGGPTGLARLYLGAGMLHLEGAATDLMSSSRNSALSSIRTAEPRSFSYIESGTDSWRRDREAARRYFDRARLLCPQLDVPALPADSEDIARWHPGPSGEFGGEDLRMPSMEIPRTPPPGRTEPGVPPHHVEQDATLRPRRRRKEDMTASMVEQAESRDDDEDNTWYLYIPGLIGAGTALLVVGVVSAISFSTWRKNQN